QVGDVLLFRQHRAQTIELRLEHGDLAPELGQPLRRRVTAIDLLLQLRELGLLDVEGGLCRRRVEIPERTDARDREADEESELRVPGQLVEFELQRHVTALPSWLSGPRSEGR